MRHPLMIAVSLGAALLTGEVDATSIAPTQLSGVHSVYAISYGRFFLSSVLPTDAAAALDDELKNTASRMLHEAGLDRPSSQYSQLLGIYLEGTVTPRCPGSVAVRVAVALTEDARLKRSPDTSLPHDDAVTWESKDLAIVPQDQLVSHIRERVAFLVERFIGEVQAMAPQSTDPPPAE